MCQYVLHVPMRGRCTDENVRINFCVVLCSVLVFFVFICVDVS